MMCAFAMISIAGYAQTSEDALRYSMLSFGGTARYASMGGAFGAVGADFSSISDNPAGLGVYRKNEFTFTPSFYTGGTSATYNGTTLDDKKYNFNLSDLGIVIARKTNSSKDQDGWKFVNFAFGLNRNNNFNNRMVIQGTNLTSSLMDVYKNQASGMPDNLDQFSTQLAYNTGLIGTNDSLTYYSNVPSGGVLQRKSITSSGFMQELVFAIGANYDNKLFIGGSFNVPFLRYQEQSSYMESALVPDLATGFQDFTFNQNLTTTGTGFNFKLGLIYNLLDIEMLKVKIGVSAHTPTFYQMHDDWSSSMESNIAGNNNTSDSPKGSFDYQLTTPMGATGSLAIQIGQYATLSADYEFIDYSSAQLSSNSFDFADENQNIQNSYAATNNFRFGAEVALGLFSLRGGYDIFSSPFQSGLNDGKRTAITGGFGIIDKNYFIDFGYVYTMSNESYTLYDYNNLVNPAGVKKNTGNFLMTLGFKF